MNWKADIEKVNNGYIVKVVVDDSEDTPFIRTLVFEEEDYFSDMGGRKSELDAFVKMVWELAEYFAINNSSHERYNLIIETIDEGKDERCENNPDNP